jgi:hypothetical protein
VGHIRNAYRILVGNIKGRDHVGDLSTDGKKILKLIIKTEVLRMWP